ncbi:MAG: SMI1/KNR4 family protein [Promethearchaeota archaeon]
MTNYGEEYMKLVSRLVREPTPDDGFMEEEIRECEKKLGMPLPRALREFYLTIGKEYDGSEHWYIYSPQELELLDFQEYYGCEPDAQYDKEKVLYSSDIITIADYNDGFAVYGFLKENSTEDNPKIYVCDDAHDQEWRDSGIICNDFLKFSIHSLVLENSPYSAFNSIDASIEEKIKNKYPLIFDHLLMRLYWQEGEIIGVDQGDYSQIKIVDITLSGRTMADLKNICDKLDLELIEEKIKIYNRGEISFKSEYTFRLIPEKLKSLKKEWIECKGEKIPVIDSLYLSNKNIKDLSEIKGLFKLKSLHKIDLRSNQLTTLQESIGNLTPLKELELYNNQLTSLPESIGNLKSLESLSLRANNLTNLPDSFANLESLQILNLQDNQLKILPEPITRLASLRKLNLINNKLLIIPEAIVKLKTLNELLLSSNQLTYLTDSIGSLRNLKNLFLGSNQLTALPESIGNLSLLDTLMLNGNKISTFPESMVNLESLTYLDIGNTRLSSFPEFCVNLASLTHLYLNYNKLAILPESINCLQSLRYLNLRKNQLTSLPESIGDLKSLRFINLGHNRLTSLPESLIEMPSLEELKIARNPLDSSAKLILEKLKEKGIRVSTIFS